MSVIKDKLISRFHAETEKTIAFFEALRESDWSVNVYSEGANWSVKEILAHFASSESGVRRLIESIIAGGEGSPIDFDLDVYNERRVGELADQSVQGLLEGFKKYRNKTIDFVSNLEETDLDREGRHPFLGLTTVREMLKLMYRHNQIHQREIRNGLKPPND